MLKALLWKEWREQRGIAFAGAAVAIMLPLISIGMASRASDAEFLEVTDIVPFLFAVLVWPLFAALAGATANAEGASMASAGFLLSRPAPRSLLWLVKVSIAVVAIAFVVTVSYYAALRVDVWVGGWGFRFPFSSDPFSWPPDHAVRAMALAALYVTFCGAAFLSTLVRRPVGAAMGGLGLAGASQFVALFAAGRIGGRGLGNGVEEFVAAFSMGFAAVLLAASLYVFRASGIGGSGDARAAGRRAWAGILWTVPLIVLLAGFATTRITPDDARVQFALTVPGTDTIVVSVRPNDFTGASLWAAEPGRPLRPLTARLADAIAVSPDGEWLVYTSRLSSIGTRAAGCTLRAARIDGSEDRELLEGADVGGGRWCYSTGGFSLDGRRMALDVYTGTGRDHLLVADLEGGAPHPIDLGGIASSRGFRFDAAWTSSDAIALYRYDYGYGDPGGYWRVDADTGTIQRLYAPPENFGFTTQASNASRLLIQERARRDYLESVLDPTPRRENTLLVEIADGSTRPIEPLCAGGGGTSAVAAMTPDGEYVFYSCRPRLPVGEEWDLIVPAGVFRGELRRRHLETGEDVLIAAFDGWVASIGASPSVSRFMVRLANPRPESPDLRALRDPYYYDRRLQYRYELVEAGGATTPLDITPDWYFVEWFGDDRAVLRMRAPYYAAPSLAYLEVGDRPLELRLLFRGQDIIR